jgi:protocatechuate 3,4-dioxygenase beta subunit
MIGAPGYRELVTALYLRNDDHIDSDTVFGVTDSLVTETVVNDPMSPFQDLPSIRFDFTLAAADAANASGRVGADPSQILHKS